MKNLLLILTLIALITSCSAVKKDRQVINAFLEKQLAGKEYDTLFIKAETGSKAGIIKFYNTAYLHYKNETYAFIPSANYTKKDIALAWALDSLKAPELKPQPEKTTRWTKADFTIPVEIVTEKTNASFVKQHLSIRNHVLHFSKPVYINNNKYALFFFDQRGVEGGFGDGFIKDQGIILMHKEKGKWKQIAVLKDISYIE